MTLPEPDRTNVIQDMLKRVGVTNEKNEIDLLTKVFGSAALSLRQVSQAIHRLGLVARSLRMPRATFITSVAVVIRTIDTDIYRQFARGTLSDLEVVDAIHEKVNIRNAELEAIIIMAAKEIASNSRNMMYDGQIESPLTDRYRQQSETSEHARTVINNLNRYEQGGFLLDMTGLTGLGFVEAVRRTELLERVMNRS